MCRDIYNLAVEPKNSQYRNKTQTNINQLKALDFSLKKCVIGALQMFAGVAIAVVGAGVGAAAITSTIGIGTGPGVASIAGGAILGVSFFAKGANNVRKGFFGKSDKTMAVEHVLDHVKSLEPVENINASEGTTDPLSIISGSPYEGVIGY